MSLFSRKKNDQDDPMPDRSVYFSNERIDRAGKTWKRCAFWFRQEHLGKLKVISHFQKRETQLLIDRALHEFIERNWDETGVVQEMVKKSTGKVKTPTV